MQELGIAPPQKANGTTWRNIKNDETFFANSTQVIDIGRQSKDGYGDDDTVREDLPPIIKEEEETSCWWRRSWPW